MDGSETVYTIESEEQLWDEIQQVVGRQCSAESHESIDDALRNWLYLASRCREDFSQSADDVALCSEKLMAGTLFHANPEYVRTQIIYSLLQEDDSAPLYVIATFLLLDGRSDESTYRMMVAESCFSRLLELLKGRKESDPDLHRLLLELMYEMSRIEQLRYGDLLQIDDGFVTYLFQLVEVLSDDVHDPYHYPIIRVLLVMNEQYMVASTTAISESGDPLPSLTNRVVKCLSLYGPQYRTFGENIILLLNRETETSMQLLILKLLYLLFTTKATYEYFYTNDLRVLLDVIIRNLLDLPNELMSLRHTYLRVLYPLLAHTQLSHPPHYKKAEIRKTMNLLAGAGNFHFAPADETTTRLVDRVNKVKWLSNEGSGASEIARKFLGISLSNDASASNISVVDVAAVTEKPGVQTPSRKAEAAEQSGEPEAESDSTTASSPTKTTYAAGSLRRPKKPLPELPKNRQGNSCAPATLLNGTGTSTLAKKLPPKAPPPRRTGRLKSSVPSPPVSESPTAATGAAEGAS